MRRRFVILLPFLLLGVFLGALLLLRLPSGAAVGIRTRRGGPDRTLLGGDGEEVRAAAELLPGERLDLNAASAEELQKLPGIGPALAQAIVDYRAEHGPFRSTEELMDVPGIGPARYAAAADGITVEGSP